MAIDYQHTDIHPYLLANPDIKKMPYSVLTLVTPELALRWLENGDDDTYDAIESITRDRRLRMSHVDELAGAMTRGEWQVTDGGIAFDWNGVRTQGKHRLTGVVKSGVSIWTWVVYDLKPRDAQLGMDTGVRRNLADFLQMSGERDSTTLAAAVGAKWRWDMGDYRSKVKPSIPQGLEVLREHPTLRTMIVNARRKSMKFHVSQADIATLWYDLNSLDGCGDEADVFFERLSSGVALEAGSPILALRHWLERRLKTGAHGREDQTMVHAMFVKAWNDWQQGIPCYVLQWRSGGAKAEPFPIPISPAQARRGQR